MQKSIANAWKFTAHNQPSSAIFKMKSKSFIGSKEVKAFHGSVIDPVLNLLNLFVSDFGKVCLFWKKSSNEPIGPFITTTLPGVVGFSKIDLHLKGVCKGLPITELRSIIGGGTLSCFWWEL